MLMTGCEHTDFYRKIDHNGCDHIDLTIIFKYNGCDHIDFTTNTCIQDSFICMVVPLII